MIPLDLPDLLGVATLERLGIRRELDARPGRDAARAQDHELPLRDREGRVVEDGPARKRRGREREEREPLLVVDVGVREDRVGTRGDGDASLAEPLQQWALDDDEPPATSLNPRSANVVDMAPSDARERLLRHCPTRGRRGRGLPVRQPA